MKKIISIIALGLVVISNAQVIIGDNIGTVPNGQKSSVLLEFAAGKQKGIILPYVRTLPAGIEVCTGTFVLDASNPSKAKVKYYNGIINATNPDGWFDLSSDNEADVTSALLHQPLAVNENSNSKVVIGAANSTNPGALVLESDTKAMVLPMIESTDQIIDPAPGMLVYINKTGAKRLAVYNGKAWTYWKP